MNIVKESSVDTFYNEIIRETINGEVSSCDEAINTRREVRKMVKKIGFDTNHEGTEFLVMIITDLLFAYNYIDKNIFEDLDNIDVINPLFDLNNETCPLYDVIVNYNNFDRNYMIEMLSDVKEKSIFKNLTLNQIIYPIVNEFNRRREYRMNQKINELLNTYGSLNKIRK